MNTTSTTQSEYLDRYRDRLNQHHFQCIRETIGTMAMEGMLLTNHDIDTLVHIAQEPESINASIQKIISPHVDVA